jgi:hypothetical protein
VTQPGNTSKRAQLVVLVETLDQGAAGAVLTILEIVADLDRRRASRLVEAVAVLIALAPRPRVRRSVRP